MIKKISLLFGLVAALPASALAWIGGPFDNGDYSSAFDDSGIYQASIRFKNGSGFAQWGSNVTLRPQTNATGAAALASQTTGSILNRSVIYANGITYVGIATGMVDTVENVIIGQTNGASDGTQASAQGADAAGGTSQVIVSNGGRRFTANAYFRAKITQKHPVLKFSGTGQINLLGPDASEIISEIAQGIVENSNANLSPQEIQIPTTYQISVRRSGTSTTTTVVPGIPADPTTTPPTPAVPPIVNTETNVIDTTTTQTFARDPSDIIADQEEFLNFAARNLNTVVQRQIDSLELVRDYLANSPAARQDMVTEKITVFGTRKFFLSTR